MTHGLTLTESSDSTVTVSPSSMAVIGLIATSEAGVGDVAANIDAAFPLNTPVLVTSVDIAAGKAGLSRESAYRLRARDPGGLFALMWDDIMAAFYTLLVIALWVKVFG